MFTVTSLLRCPDRPQVSKATQIDLEASRNTSRYRSVRPPPNVPLMGTCYANDYIVAQQDRIVSRDGLNPIKMKYIRQ
jgi:hypothetical protein